MFPKSTQDSCLLLPPAFRSPKTPSRALQLCSTFSMACVSPAGPSGLDKVPETVLVDDKGKWQTSCPGLGCLFPLFLISYVSFSLRYNHHCPENAPPPLISLLCILPRTSTRFEDLLGVCFVASTSAVTTDMALWFLISYTQMFPLL